jgi:hypothetical protein
MSLYAFSGLLDFLTSLVLGGFVLWRKPADKISKSWAFLSLSIAIFGIGQFMREMSHSSMQAFFWGGHVLFSGVILIYIAFPLFSNHLARRQIPRGVQLVFLCLMLAGLVLVNFTSLVIKPQMVAKGAFRYYSVPGPLYPLVTSVYLFVVVYGITVQFLRFRSLISIHERRQILYMIMACIIGFGGGSMNFLVDFDINIYPFGNYFIPIYTAIVSYAIVKYRLLDVTVIVRKTLVYSTVTGTLMIMYLGIIALFAHIFQGLTGAQTVFSSGAAAGLITLCFQPLRKKVQAVVDSKFFRQYVDREQKLYELSREVITHTTPEAMGGALIHVLNETLHPKGGALYLRSKDGGGFTQVSSFGEYDLPVRMDEDNELARYFKDHPQPFIRDMSDDVAESRNTRLKEGREDAA